MIETNGSGQLDDPGRVFVLSGPSGVGKNSVAQGVCRDGTAVRAVTATTREPKEGEVDEEDYYFVPDDTFARWVAEGRLLEHAEYVGNRYGTPAFSVNRALEEAPAVLLVIEVQGALQIKDRWPEVNLIFLVPPSEEELKRRLQRRGRDEAEDIQDRLTRARQEMKQSEKYDYVVVNDTLSEAVEEVKELIRNVS
jgi:guanylate kinase